MRSGLSSQLHPYIVNKTWFLSCDRILKQPIYVAGFSTSQNRVAPVLTLEGREITLQPGVFVYIPASIPHALRALENLAFLHT